MTCCHHSLFIFVFTFTGNCFDKELSTVCKRRQHTQQQHLCTVCDKHFASKRNLTMHRKSHTGKHLFSCGNCGKRFPFQSNLYAHMNTHTGKYKCTECGKCCINNSALAKHRQSHSEQKPFKCTVSSKRFTTKRDLTVRRKKHTGKHLYSCSHCGKRFLFRNSLYTHMNIHTGKYKCTECGKCCSSNYVLAKHKQSHSEQKPFKRTVSSKRFTKNRYFTVRRKRHTGNICTLVVTVGSAFYFKTAYLPT